MCLSTGLFLLPDPIWVYHKVGGGRGRLHGPPFSSVWQLCWVTPDLFWGQMYFNTPYYSSDLCFVQVIFWKINGIFLENYFIWKYDHSVYFSTRTQHLATHVWFRLGFRTWASFSIWTMSHPSIPFWPDIFHRWYISWRVGIPYMATGTKTQLFLAA